MNSTKDNLAARLESIQPLSGIQAIAPDSTIKGLSIQSASDLALHNALDHKEALAFEEAGWKFAKTKNDPDSANVVVDTDGRLKIVSDALNVRFEPSIARSDVDSILGIYGLSVRRDLGFAPNLFLVTGKTANVVNVAKELNSLDKVVYAEPVLIEALGGRGGR